MANARLVSDASAAMLQEAEPPGKAVELWKPGPAGSGKVTCTACARYCTLKEGQTGLCGVRGVQDGKLRLYVYGRVITGHVDPIEKKPVQHYMPGSRIFSLATTGCNWLCHPAGARILLRDGTTKPVEALLPGDALWSYDVGDGMRLLPNVVTHVGSRRARIWDVRYGARAAGRLLLTAEHPVLTRSGWKEVHALRPGEEILRAWCHNTPDWKRSRAATMRSARFTCTRCGRELRGLASWNRHRGACYTEGLPTPPEVRASRRQRMLAANPMKDPEVARRALASSRRRFLADPEHGWHRNVERLRDALHRRPSGVQQRLYGLLDELGVAYEREYRIRPEKRLRGSKVYYIADAAFPDLRLDVEVDGWWHHHDARVKASDRVRDRTLRTTGWEVLRIDGSHLARHPEEVKALLAEHLARPPMQNQRAWVRIGSVAPTDRVEPVYSFECIPNHTYVADGVVVHNCQYCQNYDISQRRKVEGQRLDPPDIVDLALESRSHGLAYTYNQPSIWMEFARDIGLEAHKKGLFNIFVSNGYDTPEGVREMDKFLDCITVDFKGNAEPGFVRKYIGVPDPEPIFDTLHRLRTETRIHVEITDLVVPQVGDSLEAARKLCKRVYDEFGELMPIHFLRWHPDYKMLDLPLTPIKTLEAHWKVAKETGFQYAYLGNVHGHPLEDTYCHGCHEVVVGRYGFEIERWNLETRGLDNFCKHCGTKVPIHGPLSPAHREDRFFGVV